MNKKLGVFPTMVTPYTKEGKVDYEGVQALVEWYWKRGVMVFLPYVNRAKFSF
jgi:4-hydroxy-tetrahydrodipicolinate synthase